MLGKRKRNAAVVCREGRDGSISSDGASGTETTDTDVFRQYFEAIFEPLPNIALPTVLPQVEGAESDDDNESDDSEWDGISNIENDGLETVQVVEHSNDMTNFNDRHSAGGTAIKAFMGSKPPSANDRTALTSTVLSSIKDDPKEAANLKNDLDLQRLLQESSLLKKSKGPTGVNVSRHKTTDLRLQSLGVKSSLYGQQKMPMAHRKGMQVKTGTREDVRRRDARENGIILEKLSSVSGKVGKAKMRERGVGGPGVGQFRGGTLQLSRKDLVEIQGSKKGTRKGKQ